MSPAIRIFRWADAPEEYRVVERRAWLAFVPAGKTFNAATDARWTDVVVADVAGGQVQAGNDA